MTHWKGGAGERQVIALLEPWWRRLEPEAAFFRTPGSGGFAKKLRNVPPGFKGAGDLMVDPLTTKRWVGSVEVKYRNVITEGSVDRFRRGLRSPVWGYWEQCEADAAYDGLIPMLWLRGTRMEWRVAVGDGGSAIRLFRASELVRIPPARFAR